MPRLGEEIDQLRQEQGLSFRELAFRADVSLGYLWDLVSGRRGHRPSLDVVARIAAALGVDLDHFTSIRRQRALDLFGERVDELYRGERGRR